MCLDLNDIQHKITAKVASKPKTSLEILHQSKPLL